MRPLERLRITTFLLYTTLGESMQYYKYVDEVTAEPQTWQGKKMQVHGYVVTESIKRKEDALEYKFDVQRNGQNHRSHRHDERSLLMTEDPA